MHPSTKQCNYSYTHPSSIQCNAATEINNLKSSVSSGKTQVANAITGKGVSASGNDTFATLASKISQIKSQPTSYQFVLNPVPYYNYTTIASGTTYEVDLGCQNIGVWAWLSHAGSNDPDYYYGTSTGYGSFNYRLNSVSSNIRGYPYTWYVSTGSPGPSSEYDCWDVAFYANTGKIYVTYERRTGYSGGYGSSFGYLKSL